jgi:hypothetical protein
MLMTTTELTMRLNTAYSLLKETVEADIYSAHHSDPGYRPVIPSYVESIYSRLVQAVELERDVEDGLITADDFD